MNDACHLFGIILRKFLVILTLRSVSFPLTLYEGLKCINSFRIIIIKSFLYIYTTTTLHNLYIRSKFVIAAQLHLFNRTVLKSTHKSTNTNTELLLYQNAVPVCRWHIMLYAILTTAAEQHFAKNRLSSCVIYTCSIINYSFT